MASTKFIGEWVVVVLVASTYQWYILYEEEGNKMYVLHDSLFLQDVLDLVDLIVAMGLLPIIDGTIQSGGQRE